MSASTNDKITYTRNSARPNSARVSSPRSAGGTTLACDSLTGWPTASKVHFVTYQIDTNSDVVAGTQLDCYGIVSGNSIGSLYVVDGTDNGNSVGDVVEMMPTAGWGQDLAEGIAVEHTLAGVHNSTAATTIGAYLYPVGSIYINASVATNPASLLGFGTWSAFGAGKVPVGVDTGDTDFDTVAETGGSKTSAHTHVLDGTNAGAAISMVGASGTSTLNMYRQTVENWTANVDNSSSMAFGGSTTAKTSGAKLLGSTQSGSSSTVQPYITVYMWKRIA